MTVLYVTDIQNDSYSWPLLVYMGTSCVYPLASSCAHTFSSMSRNARHICYFLDYGAVNLFGLGTWGPALALPPGNWAAAPSPGAGAQDTLVGLQKSHGNASACPAS